jgi:hypothetical protein
VERFLQFSNSLFADIQFSGKGDLIFIRMHCFLRGFWRSSRSSAPSHEV